MIQKEGAAPEENVMLSPDDYESLVASAVKQAEEGKSFVIYNRSVQHASVLIRNLFSSAKSEICVLSGAMRAPVFEDDAVMIAAKQLIARGGKLRILLDGRSQGSADFLSTSEMHEALNKPIAKLADENSSKGSSIRIVPRSLATAYEYHFVVADAKAYRFEPIWSSSEAYAQFADEDFGKKLMDIFSFIDTKSSIRGSEKQD